MAPKPTRAPAVTAMLQHEFEEKPFGGWDGELTPVPPVPTPPPQPTGIGFEPPDWEAEYREQGLDPQAPPPEPEPTLTALEQMMSRAAALGEIEEREYGLPVPPGPPPERFTPPEPDWEAEEREQAARERAEKRRLTLERKRELIEELLAEETDSSYPATRRGAA